MVRIYHRGNVWETKQYNTYLNIKKFNLFFCCKMEDINYNDTIVIEYKGKFYESSSFKAVASLGGMIKIDIDNIVDVTRDIKIKLINDEKI